MMFVLFVKKKNRTFWQLFTGRTLNWVPLSDTKVKTMDSGTTSGGDWWYSFNTRAAALKGKKEFERVNAKESGTYTTAVRERKTTVGLG